MLSQCHTEVISDANLEKGMDYCRTDRDKMIAGVMAAVLATQGTAWALAVGFGLNIFLSNWDPRKKEENAIEDKN